VPSARRGELVVTAPAAGTDANAAGALQKSLERPLSFTHLAILTFREAPGAIQQNCKRFTVAGSSGSVITSPEGDVVVHVFWDFRANLVERGDKNRYR